MVVAYRTQSLFNFGKTIRFPKTVPLTNGKRSIYGGSSSQRLRLIGDKYRNNLRLCGCRHYHPKETRPMLAKLTPQEVQNIFFVNAFYKPNCEYAGLSCLDCYSRKQCINLFGLRYWATEVCGTSFTGEANIYCNPKTDTCTSVVPEGCVAISRYNCLRDGLLPNIKDCSLYHKCFNSSAEDLLCDQNYVYKQTYGKCVIKLSDNDCVTLPSCGLQDFVQLYPGDSSIYYSCIASKFSIKACKETETFNLDTNKCESKCKTNGRLPNSRNCSMYYECSTSNGGSMEIKKISCPEGKGYNPSSKTCQSNYKNLCNELYLLETDVYDLITFTSVIEIITKPIKNLLNYLNINPMKVLFLFGLSDQTLSDGILIVDYVYKNKQLPTTTLGYLVDAILPYLPFSFQSIIKTMINLGVIKLRSTLPLTKYNQENEVRDYLITVLSDITIDIPLMIKSFEGKNQDEISRMIFNEAIRVFQIPEYQVPFIVGMLKTNLPILVINFNSRLGTDLLTAKEGNLRFNLPAVDTYFNNNLDYIALKMYPENGFLATMFKMFAKYKYAENYAFIRYIVDNVYFTVNALF